MASLKDAWKDGSKVKVFDAFTEDIGLVPSTQEFEGSGSGVQFQPVSHSETLTSNFYYTGLLHLNNLYANIVKLKYSYFRLKHENIRIPMKGHQWNTPLVKRLESLARMESQLPSQGATTQEGRILLKKVGLP